MTLKGCCPGVLCTLPVQDGQGLGRQVILGSTFQDPGNKEAVKQHLLT